MTNRLFELRIEDLLFGHREVSRKKVRKYMSKYVNGESIDAISVIYCVHTGKYHVSDGHHKTVAKHFLKKSSILAKISTCYLLNCDGVQTECEPFYNIRHMVLE